MARYNTVRLATYGAPPVEVERYCAAAIKPGMFCHLDTDGTIIPEDAAGGSGGASPKLIAIENTHLGMGITDDWNDSSQDYQTGDLVTCYHVRSGDKVWCWLGVGPDANARIGRQFHAWGADTGFDGTLLVNNNNPRGIVGTPNENIDNSAGLVPVRIEVIIL